MIKTDKLNNLSISFGSLTIRILDVGGTPTYILNISRNIMLFA